MDNETVSPKDKAHGLMERKPPGKGRADDGVLLGEGVCTCPIRIFDEKEMQKTISNQDIVRQFRELFRKNGAVESPDEPWFREADPMKMLCLTDLYGTYSRDSSVYLNDELRSLRGCMAPAEMIIFYRYYEPCNLPDTRAGVTLLDLDGIRAENSSGAPGGILIRYRLITFATTIGGMAVCVDLNHRIPNVVLVDDSGCYSADCVKSYRDVKKLSHPVARSFTTFLQRLSKDQYDDLEDTVFGDD